MLIGVIDNSLMLSRIILFIKKIHFLIRYGRQFHSVGNVKIGKNLSVIFENKNCECSIGSNVVFGSNVVLHCDGSRLIIGDNTTIDHNTVLRLWGGEIIIGNNVYINSCCVLDGHGLLSIGDNCLIGMQVAVIPSNHIIKDLKMNINRQGEEVLPVIIEENVWIGSGAKILAGVHLKKGSVIGSNAVVKNSVEENTIAVGVPAKKMIKR